MSKYGKRGTHSVLFTWAPLIVSLLAVIFTGLQWFEAHRQKRLQTKPLVSFYIESDVRESKRGVAIENLGPGPAVIKSVRYFVDRRPIDAEEDVLKYGNLNSNLDNGIELAAGDAVGVGQRVWLIDYRTKSQKELDQLMEFLDSHLAVEVSYCSIDNECWKKCSSKGQC